MTSLRTLLLVLALALPMTWASADQGVEPVQDLTSQDQTTAENVADDDATPRSSKESLEESLEENSEESTEDPGELFVNANTSYEEGDAARAVELYTALLQQGYGSAELYYNLGNAYLRNGELGRAIASYRRSNALQPRDEDVAANLSFARKSIKDAIAPPQPSAIASTLFFWHYSLSRGELAMVVLLLNFLFFALLAVRFLSQGGELLRWATMVVLLLLLASSVSLGLRYFAPQRVAVIIPQEIGAHNGPNPEAVVRFKLHAGTEVRVEDSRDAWLRIRLPDGQQGWIQKDWADVVGL